MQANTGLSTPTAYDVVEVIMPWNTGLVSGAMNELTAVSVTMRFIYEIESRG